MNKGDTNFNIDFHTAPPEKWDAFVMGCEPSHFEQTSWLANVESEDGWSARYVVAREGGRIVAGALVLLRRKRKIGKVGYIFRGPLICKEHSDSECLSNALAVALKDFARKENLVVLVVVPTYYGGSLTTTLSNRGFIKHYSSLPPTGLPTGCITIDLRKGLEIVENEYRRTLRKQISRAGRRGVIVKLGSAKDLNLFWVRHQELCRRRGVASNIPSFSYLERIWQEFHKQGRVWMFNACLDKDILASLICLAAGKWFYAWRIGWAPYHERAYPTQAAFYQAIRTAAMEGYFFFDFMGIDRDEAMSFENGDQIINSPSGITF